MRNYNDGAGYLMVKELPQQVQPFWHGTEATDILCIIIIMVTKNYIVNKWFNEIKYANLVSKSVSLL